MWPVNEADDGEDPPIPYFIATKRPSAPTCMILSRAEGVWVWDARGKRYLDCLSAYSAVDQATAIRNPGRYGGTGRQADIDLPGLPQRPTGPLYEQIVELTRSHKVPPMNSGAEVATRRRWLVAATFNCQKDFVCNRDEGRRYSRPIGSLRDDGVVPLICPTCQVFAGSLKVSCQRLLLLCMGLFSIFCSWQARPPAIRRHCRASHRPARLRRRSRCGRARPFTPLVPGPPRMFP
jgi:hypothetical protein